MLPIVIAVVIIVIVIIILLTCCRTYPGIARLDETLDAQHTAILDSIDDLYKKSFDHWQEEEKLYKIGASAKSKSHVETDALWKHHQKEHTDLLRDIKAMKNRIITHINTEDAAAFHWLN